MHHSFSKAFFYQVICFLSEVLQEARNEVISGRIPRQLLLHNILPTLCNQYPLAESEKTQFLGAAELKMQEKGI